MVIKEISTVEELIRALEQCPRDAKLGIDPNDGNPGEAQELAIILEAEDGLVLIGGNF
jgi:hypothetical protein